MHMAKEISTEKGERPLVRRSTAMAPFEDMEHWFEDFSRRFDELFSSRWLHPFERGWPALPELRGPFEGKWPRVDVIDRDTEVIVKAELPGVTKENLDVSLAENTVTIKATTQHEEKEERGQYYHRETSRGEFQRTVMLPAEVKEEQAKATFKDGILELTLPKAAPAKRKTIKVE
jgi:HSP20 family protein